MNKIKLGLFLTTLMIGFSSRAQSVDEIISKNTAALGGIDKLAGIKSMNLESVLQVMGGDNPSSSTVLIGTGFISSSDINGMKVVQCYTDKSGWFINQFTDGTAALPMPDEQYQAGRDQIYSNGSLSNYAANGFKAELIGKDSSNFKIRITSGSQFEKFYYIDATTWLVTKITSKGFAQGQPVDMTFLFSDYQKTDYGTLVARKMDATVGEFQLTYLIKKVEINKDVDPKIFEIPK